MTDDHHHFFISVGEHGQFLNVTCPYEVGDVTRPCWPCDIDTHEPYQPDSDDASSCVYADWIDNLSAEEIMVGERQIELENVTVDWENESIQVHL